MIRVAVGLTMISAMALALGNRPVGVMLAVVGASVAIGYLLHRKQP